MQVPITAEEQKAIILLTKGKGNTKWFLQGAEMSYTPLSRMKEQGRADKEMVDKARAFLKRKDVKALIAQLRENEGAAA